MVAGLVLKAIQNCLSVQSFRAEQADTAAACTKSQWWAEQCNAALTFLQKGQPSNSYSSIGLAGRFLKFLRLSLTKAAVPRRNSAGAPA